MNQQEAVITAIEQAGGMADLPYIYRAALGMRECAWNAADPSASIRCIVQRNKKIYKIKPGVYALKSHKAELEARGIFAEGESRGTSADSISFNHTYYQGLLLVLGKLKNFATFAPQQDKRRMFVNRPIGDVRTLQKLPSFSHAELVKRSSSIDVIWFNERNMPEAFFEVEYTTDFQNSLLKFNDLRDFNARMIIVADKSRHEEFTRKLAYSAFDGLRKNNRVEFLSFQNLEKQYKYELERSSLETLL